MIMKTAIFTLLALALLVGAAMARSKASAATPTLPDRNAKVTMAVGQVISYAHMVHASVGISYRVEYDKRAFMLSYKHTYNHPEAMQEGLCGGDDATLTTSFKALKKGTFVIKVVHEFRGSVERTLTYKVNVR